MNSEVKKGRRYISVVLASVIVLSALIAGFAGCFTVSAASDSDTIASYAPSGMSNVAVGSSVSISKATANRAGSEDSYEMTSEGWCKAYLVDGTLNKCWSTNPYDRQTDVNVPVTVTVELATAAEISRIVLFPRGNSYFPEDYTVLVSIDGEEYEEVASSSGNAANRKDPAIHDFEKREAKYIMIHVTKRGAYTGGDGALVQFKELAVYGNFKFSLELNKSSLELCAGESDKISVSAVGTDDEIELAWKSENKNIAAVDQNGNITGVAVGNTTVTVEAVGFGVKEEINVYVVEKESLPGDQIMLSIFWPPTPDYVTDEQYKLMADAGINWVMGAGEETLCDKDIQLKIAELSYKYGMNVIMNDGRFGHSLLGKSEEEIIKLVDEYRNVPGIKGYYILDEPFNPNLYIDAYAALKKADPTGNMHLNFLPSFAYSSTEAYMDQMADWCKLCEATGYPLDYLMYDRYPFGLQAGSMDREGFLTNLKACHDVGLEHGVKTGTYIQTVCQQVSFRRPTDSEIRYEMYMSLAYGYKQLSFFTWFTPVNRSEPFADGIISADGVPNAHYETVSTINHEILAMGEILVKCDALEIYLNGSTWGQEAIPSDFVLTPKDKKNYTVSRMVHSETGRNYLMIVNNNFSAAQTVKVELADGIDKLWLVSKTDGTLSEVDINDGILEIELAAGDGYLYALPEDYACSKDEIEVNTEKGVNLALDAYVTANESLGENGYYISNINDGDRAAAGVNGWATDGSQAYLIFDIGTVTEINRIDIYPSAGNFVFYGQGMPSEFTVSVSSDGEAWTPVITQTGYTLEGDTVPSFKFDAVDARYVKFEFPQSEEGVKLAEIEIYDDDGSVPPAQSVLADLDKNEIINYKEGMNLALKRPTYVSSTVPEAGYRGWGWASDFGNDGDITTGHTSMVGRHTSEDAEEYIIIDLGDMFDISKIDLVALGKHPVDYVLSVSEDARTWKTFASVKGERANNGDVKTYTSEEPMTGRFVRLYATKLLKSGADGYLFQIGEIEVYGKPNCDKSELSAAIDAYVASGFDTTEKVYTDAVAARDDANTTQNLADSLTEAINAILPPPIIEDETDTDTTSPDAESSVSEDSETSEPEEETADTSSNTEDVNTETATEAVSLELDSDEISETVADENADSPEPAGCKSSLGAPMALLATVLSAAGVASAKRKEN